MCISSLDSCRFAVRVLGGLLILGFLRSPVVLADSPSDTAALKRIFDGGEPTTIAELRAMETHQRELAQKVMGYTVGIIVGHSHGSGVIISEDGYVLTAAHVAGAPNRNATFILSDGRRVRGKTLGLYRTLDAGLMKITADGKWPHAELADPKLVKEGQWCIASGHPGGFEEGRKPVVRVGRVLVADRFAITTDCTLVGGDSGGPLFDMDGKVIGVNSRIGRFLTANLHVPVGTYRETWDRLAKAEAWGNFLGTGPYLGVHAASDTGAAKIAKVVAGTPADKAGIKPGDIIVQYNGQDVTDFASLQLRVNDSMPGDKVAVVVLRGETTVNLQLVVGQREREG